MKKSLLGDEASEQLIYSREEMGAEPTREIQPHRQEAQRLTKETEEILDWGAAT